MTGTFRFQVVCNNCTRLGYGHTEACDCAVSVLPVQSAVDAPQDSTEPDSPFARTQAERDRYAYLDGAAGDVCRRWSTCHRCGHISGEMSGLWEQEGWESYHTQWGCAVERIDRSQWDMDLGWPPHPVWTYTRCLLPAIEVEHVTARRNLTLVSGRAPQASVIPIRRGGITNPGGDAA